MYEKKNLWISNSRKLYLPVYFMIFVLVATIGFIKINDLRLNNFVLIGAGVFIALGIFFTELHRAFEGYKVTPHYLVQSRGIVSKKLKKILISSIVDIDQKQTFWQLMLGFGDVEVHVTSGTNIIKIKDIARPGEFVDFLEEILIKKIS